MSDSLDSWLPRDPEDSTRVFDPVIIDKHAKADLQGYHPKDSIEKPFTFRLVRFQNTAFATVEVLNDHWTREFRGVLQLLRLRVVNEGQCDEHLLDDRVEGSANFPMTGWKVVNWTIRRTGYDGHADPPELAKLTDRIVWQRLDDPNVKAVSSYTWLPYKK